MGVVADRAGVTRALVYKHFANKHDLLVALYRREKRRHRPRHQGRGRRRRPSSSSPSCERSSAPRSTCWTSTARSSRPVREAGADQTPPRPDQHAVDDQRTVRYFAGLTEHRSSASSPTPLARSSPSCSPASGRCGPRCESRPGRCTACVPARHLRRDDHRRPDATRHRISRHTRPGGARPTLRNPVHFAVFWPFSPCSRKADPSKQ